MEMELEAVMNRENLFVIALPAASKELFFSTKECGFLFCVGTEIKSCLRW